MSTDETHSEAFQSLSTEEMSVRSAALKADANRLFAQKRYEDAIKVYSEAIAIDKDNAVLYCNRSASYFAIHSFGRACQDAFKASELDPSYTKAFSRLASAQHALQLYGKSAQSWKRALETIPSGDTSEVSAKLRIDYGKNLAEAQHLHTRLEQGSVPIPGHPDKRQIVTTGRKYPWDRAQEMIPRLMAQGITKSSAYALVGSWQNLSPAIEILALARTQGSDTGMGGTGVRAVLLLSNAILADSRCLFLSFKDILPNLQFQMRMELILARTPKDLLDVDAFSAGMRALHAEGGHDISRKPFSLAVRAGIIDAYVTAHAGRMFNKAVERYDKVLAILDWGREEWHGVSDENRGVVFQDTFIRGIRLLRLQAYRQALYMPQKDPELINLDGLWQGILELSADVVQNRPPGGDDPGFCYSFYFYIAAEALAIRGWYLYNKVALAQPCTSPESVADCKASLRLSGDCYLKAAKILPEDDERHSWYLKVGLDQLFSAGEPLRVTLPIMERIRLALPLSEEIWRFSETGLAPDGQEKDYDDLTTFESHVMEMLANGAYTLEQHVAPEWIRADSRRYFGGQSA